MSASDSGVGITNTFGEPIAVRKTRREVGAVISICIAFVVLNTSVAMLYPPVNADEVLFTDPAVNLAAGKGFRSSVWYTQPYDSLYASNAPLYSLVLAAWIRVTGFTPVAVRMLNYVLMAAGIAVVWFSLAKSELIKSSGNRLLFVCAAMLGEGVTVAYRMGRYDALGILVVSLIWTVSVAPSARHRLRAPILVLLGALLVLSGYQNVLFLLLFAGLSCWWMGKRRVLSVGLPVGLGVVCALVCLCVSYYSAGSLHYFVRSLAKHSGASRSFLEHASAALAAVRKDHSSIILLLACCLLILGSRGRRYGYRPVTLGLLVLVALPATMGFVYRFQDYYSWMKYVPGVVCILVAIEDQSVGGWRRKLVWVANGLVVLACLGGPARVGIAAMDCDEWDYTRVERFVNSNVGEEDVVLLTPEAYYPAKRRACFVYSDRYLPFLSPCEKRKISVVVCRPDTAESITDRIGGDWSLVADFDSRPGSARFARLGVDFGWPPYRLAAYRRTTRAERILSSRMLYNAPELEVRH